MSRKIHLLLLLTSIFVCSITLGFGQNLPSAKVTCTPCEDYYGMGGGPPAAQTLVVADTVPGRFLLIHLEDPDTNTWFIEGDFYIDVNNYATVQSGDTAVFQFSQNGTYTINFQGIYGVGGITCYHYGSVTIEVTGFPMTAASEPLALNDLPTIKAFPNPSSGIVHVEWQDKSASQTVATLLGMRGEVIRSGIRFVDGKMEIDLSELANGPYHLAFIGPAKLFVTTIIKD
jgi:hypothetical protein